MSWEVRLVDRYDNSVKVAVHNEGGILVAGGTDRAEMNVTFNYSKRIIDALGVDFTKLNHMRAGDTIKALHAAVEKLGTDRSDDYWADTPGNVGHMLSVLLGWALSHPNAHFRIE